MSALQQRLEVLNTLFVQFPEAEQNAILKALRKQLILAEAEALSKSRWTNEVSEEEISAVARQVRQDLYEARKNNS